MVKKVNLNAWDRIDDFINEYQRGDGLKINGKPSYDIEQAGKYIARNDVTWNGHDVLGKEAVITYSFPSWKGIKENAFGDKLAKTAQFSTLQQKQAELSLQTWSEIANIKFVKVDGDEYSNITFGNIDDPYTQAYATLPYTIDPDTNEPLLDHRGYDVSGQSWYSVKGDDVLDPESGNYGRLTFVHEIGHTIGLDHPGNYNAGEGSPSYKSATYAEDTRQYSVMSYWDETYTKADHGGYFASAPLMDDIEAIQYLYGANMSTRTEDNVYGFNSNTHWDFYSANSSSDKLVFCVWDAGGNDTFDFSGYRQDQRINLNEGTFSDVGGLKGNVSIAKGVTIENTIGGSGNDIIIGNKMDNLIKGGSGNDVIFGGEGKDSLWGGSGKDIFVFTNANDSLVASPDKIMDFETKKDKIDLSFFNIKEKEFIHFVDELSGKAGEALLTYDSSADMSELKIDFSGNNAPDFMLQIVGKVNVESDFIV